ncbi:MAG: CPBP family intramembrane glutamic endopeptidase [Anaerolineae bacterium]|nr:CPBP family glutamic-type intramembrane protease [Thermoflexales bacterium]MDW8407799.1 CPBP family intramembrane glutamic endopeptidase [Anaerolineae bacterium]
MHPTTAHTQAYSLSQTAGARLRSTIILVAVIWLSGLIGHFTPLAEWPALVLYVLGSIGLALYHNIRYADWRGSFITRHNLRSALIWGVGSGVVLTMVGLLNTLVFYAGGGKPMTQMQTILIDVGFVYLFPVLALAEEWLWRGLALSALLDHGVNRHAAVALTTLAYMVNHFFVAPVGWIERGMMALMGLPIGLLAGYLTLKTRNAWSAVVVHVLIMASMMIVAFLPVP